MEQLSKPIRAVAVLVAAVMLAGLTGAAASASTAATSRSSSSTLQGVAQAEQVRAGTITSRVRGEFGRNGTVHGTFKPDRWIHRGGKVLAVGQLHAVLRRGNGTLVGTADRQVTLPLRNGSVPGARLAPCDTRTPTSLARSADRASSRLATLLQAISNTNPTAPIIDQNTSRI